MRTLLVLRHAKSPRPEGVADHERPILPEGREQISRLAHELAEERLVPAVILTSNARRAMATAEAYAKAAPSALFLPLPELYDPGDAEDLLSAIQAHGGTARTVLVVGHNPGLEDLCNRLTRRPLIDRFETGALASFATDVAAWADLRFGDAALLGLWHSH